MATVNATENPTIVDTIVIELKTPNDSGCFVENPYKVDNLKIYYIERDFSSGNFSQYNQTIYEPIKLAEAEEAEKAACADPTEDTINHALRLREEAVARSVTTPLYFNEAKCIAVIGSADYPAWLSSDTDNALIENIDEDDDGNTIYGTFQYEWNPVGQREGDYFVCWTWTPNPAGDSLSDHFKFTVLGKTEITQSIPTHFTDPDKYETLLEAYLPEMFKEEMCVGDKTIDVLTKLNGAIASGFTYLENFANQIVDLQDANSTHEALIPLLSNFFDLKLKSGDPTLWRRQIKEAIPTYKRKGTIGGLKEALRQAGIQFNKITHLWQVVSPYTWQESFIYEGTNFWELDKVALPVDEDNFELWIRYEDEEDYTQLSSDYVSFDTADGVTTMYWEGENLSVNNLSLISGDIIKVLYKYTEIPGSTEQNIENYIRDLPLADIRDERDQTYPVKNWNVRLIEDDDILFDIVVPDRHPFHEYLVFGQIRTEFPYSENIYNMEEYNGSIRNSKNPCDISRDFRDPCGACLSSKFNLDLEITQLSNDRIVEAQDIVREYSPFHAVLHTLNFVDGINEDVVPPIEEVELLVQLSMIDTTISGEGQMWFNRAMKRGTTTAAILRDELAATSVEIADTGIAYNDNVTVFSPDVKFDAIGMNNSIAIMEIFSPSVSSGIYSVSDFDGNSAVITGISEPIDTSSFTFRLSREVLSSGLVDIYQDNLVVFSDDEQDFGTLGVKSTWDIDHGGYSGDAWTIYLPAYSATPYTVYNVLPNGGLVLEDPSQTLPTSNVSDASYSLINSVSATILSSDNGSLSVTKRGRIDTTDDEIQEVAKIGYYFLIGSDQYKIIGHIPDTDDQFYIAEYDSGNSIGISNLVIYQRLADNEIGYLSYAGMNLRVSGVNYETLFDIQNGTNAPSEPLDNSKFKENYLILIGTDWYFMADIDGNSPLGDTTITLSGPGNYWKTIGNGGTNVGFTIYNYTKNSIIIPGQQFDLQEHEFESIDRQGREIITLDEESQVFALAAVLNNGDISEENNQSESITFQVQYKNGETGEL